MDKILKVSRWLLVGLVCLAIVALMYQWLASRRDLEKFPPRGELYSVNDQMLHLTCLGEPSDASPTVILESGRLSHSMIWAQVMDAVSESHHVCAYDRPGLGWSAASKSTLTAAETVTNLHGLLDSAEIAPPYILVGHSMGGVLMRDYAKEYPEQVGGMVLVDSSTERQRVLYPEEHMSDRDLRLLDVSQPLFSVFGHLGGFRTYYTFRQTLYGITLSESEQRWQSRRNQSHFGATLVNEVLLGERTLSREQSAMPLGDVPLFVLEKTFEIPEGATAYEIAHEEEWREEQQKLVRLSSNTHWVEAKDSGHDIPSDDPELVSDAIFTILGEVAGN